MKRTSISYEFVEFVPPELEEGTLYISIEYATAVHRCACGCGNKVVTPISPAEWQLLYDGDSVSLMPSIGNWQFPCRSHYWIRRNKIKWAAAWTDEEIAEGRRRDAEDLESYFTGRRTPAEADLPQTGPNDSSAGLLRRILRWVSH
jgi:hypothetical protein